MTIVHLFKNPPPASTAVLCGRAYRDSGGNHLFVRRHDQMHSANDDEEWCKNCENHPHFDLILLANTDLE